MNTHLSESAVRLSRALRATVLACALAGGAVSAQTIGNSWEGLKGPNGAVPPDVHGAPGPEGVIATVNLQIAYFSKTGTTNWGPTNLSAFWSSAGNTGNGLSDPKAIFDHDSRRFFVIMQENTASRFWLNVAVSRNSDPQTASSADWYLYRLNATEYVNGNLAGGTNYGGDYPGLAVDAQGLYATYRMYAFLTNGTLSRCGCVFTNVGLLIMNKSQLLSGTGNLTSTYLSGFQTQPVTPYGFGPGNVMYMVEHWNATTLRITSVTDPLGSRTVNTQFITVSNRGGGATNGAPQLGSVNTIPTINRTLNNASLVDGDIWLCRTDGQPGGPAVANYFRLRLNGWPSSGSVSLVEDATVGSGAYWNFCPAIGVNQAGEVAITWTRSSPTTYPTMMYAYRNAGDSSFGAAQVVKASATANNDGRWGDYATVWPDPNDGSLWIAHEWTRTDTGTWSTWWAQVLTPAKDFYVDWDAPFPLIQNGSLSYPYTTVQAAHANITHGVIHIFGGQNYNEQFKLNKAVQLRLYSGNAFSIGKP